MRWLHRAMEAVILDLNRTVLPIDPWHAKLAVTRTPQGRPRPPIHLYPLQRKGSMPAPFPHLCTPDAVYAIFACPTTKRSNNLGRNHWLHEHFWFEKTALRSLVDATCKGSARGGPTPAILHVIFPDPPEVHSLDGKNVLSVGWMYAHSYASQSSCRVRWMHRNGGRSWPLRPWVPASSSCQSRLVESHATSACCSFTQLRNHSAPLSYGLGPQDI